MFSASLVAQFRRITAGLAAVCFSASVLAQSVAPPTLAAKSWLLLEYGSGQILSSQAPDTKIEPASLTKLMTAYLTFSALRQKTLRLEQVVPVSETAWKAQGSRMFIDPKQTVTVGDLIKGMIIQSGNDACVALAEAIAGSEASFADLMTREAQRLGMSNTRFMNSTGLPDPQHMTTAADLAKLATAIVRDYPEEYARYYSQKEFTWNRITQPNRNRLLFADPSVDGMKTGFTEAAGYCLITSAKRGPRRLISVVLGTESDYARASESQKLLGWGWQAFDAVKVVDARQALANLRVYKGAENAVSAGFTQELVLALPKGSASQVKAELVAPGYVIAPIAAGQKLGTVRITVAGQIYGEYPAVALAAVPEAGFFGRLIDRIRLWFA
jgi:D-alanyl-D-alanine carboxypeptidase (penicillin-binding protein 5/6)